VSLTPLKPFHWHSGNSDNVEFLSEYEAVCETVLARESGP
jgi:hypothetical protein